MKKRFMAMFLILLLCIFQSEKAYADAAATAQLVNYSSKMAPALLLAGPEIAIIACAIVACGIIYENREQIVATSATIYNDMKTVGIPFARDVSTGAINMTTTARDFIVSSVSSMQRDGLFTASGDVLVPNQYIFHGTYTMIGSGLTFPFTKTLNLTKDWRLVVALLGTTSYYSIQSGIDNYWIGSLDEVRDVSLTDVVTPNGTVVPDSSVCTNLPTSMFPTGTIDVPLATSNIPVGSISVPINPPIGGTWDKGIDGVIGATDWTGALEDIGAVPYTGDIPIDTPSDIPIVGPLIDWLTIDWPAVTGAMDFGDVWKKHFEPFYDITDSLTDINVTPNDSGGKFYMIIPKAMGGDGLSHCVLDYTVGSVYISWARTFMGWAIWLAFGWWILEIFKPKININ